MDEDELVVIKRYDREHDAELVRSYLESNGIEALTVNAIQPPLPHYTGPNMFGNVGILVRRKDLREARELIGDYEGIELDELEEQAMEEGDETQGVRGWLQFFCLCLIVLVPFFSFAVGYDAWRELKPYYLYMPGVQHFITLEMILRAFSIGFGMIAGILLWKKSNKAVWTTRVFLVSLLALAIYLSKSQSFLALRYDVKLEPAGSWKWMSIYPVLVFVILWLGYLWRSKRVAATYGKE